MKKSLHTLVFSFMLFATPFAFATVFVNCEDLGGGTVEVTYDMSQESSRIAAFAFKLTIGNPATIDSIFDYKIGVSTAEDPGYGIFPGSIDLSNPSAPVWNDPLANPSDSGSGGGLETNNIVVEMGVFYEDEEDAPLPQGTLFKIFINGHGASAVDLHIELEDVYRSGIILENGQVPDSQLNGCTVAVPEPATFCLLALGCLLCKRKKPR